MLAGYDRGFNPELLVLQPSCQRDGRALDLNVWRARPKHDHLLEGLASLGSPLL